MNKSPKLLSQHPFSCTRRFEGSGDIFAKIRKFPKMWLPCWLAVFFAGFSAASAGGDDSVVIVDRKLHLGDSASFFRRLGDLREETVELTFDAADEEERMGFAKRLLN